MALQLVNTAPGSLPGDHAPGRAVHLGMRSTAASVVPGSIQVDLSLTSIQHSPTLPPDENTSLGAVVVLEAVERQRPEGAEATVSIGSGELQIAKASNDETEKSVFEIWTQIREDASLLAHFTFRLDPSGWVRFSPSWTQKTDIVAPFMGVEHGTFNTAVYLYLRDNGAGGSLVIAGPLAEAGEERQGLTEVSYAWTAAPDGTVRQLWVFFDASSRTVEIWSGEEGEPPTTLLATKTIASLGTFPSNPSTVANTRDGASDEGRLFLGNAGRSGDVVIFPDWAFFPDFRKAVVDGQATANHELVLRPDSPLIYDPAGGVLPTESVPGPWEFDDNAGAEMELHYAPGNPYEAEAVKISKGAYGRSRLQRDEPRIGALDSGFMVELRMKADLEPLDGGETGIGVRVFDGVREFAFYIYSAGGQSWISFPGSSVEADIQDYVVARFTVDRLRSKVNLYVSGVLKASAALTDFSAFAGDPNLSVGFIYDTLREGDFYLRALKYLTRYFAWEGTVEDGTDGLVPSDGSLPAAARFTLSSSGTGSSIIDAGTLVLDKTEYVSELSKRYYTKAGDFSEIGGAWVEFSLKVDSYTGGTGAPEANLALGAGLALSLGNKRVEVGLFDCGTGGRKIGIIPGSGTVDDIIDGTALGLRFSAVADWGSEVKCRLELIGRDKITLYIDDVAAITIPWRNDVDGFDLPTEVATAAISFGHFTGTTSSKVRWRFVRWGMSNGFDATVKQNYPDGHPDYLFGGRVYLVSEFDEA